MKKRYAHLTSPMTIRGKTLKSRLIYPVAQPHFLQANELYPADQTLSFYEERARNGAAMIWMQDCTDMTQRNMPADVGHFNMYDIHDKGVQNGLNQFSANMHLYGTLVCPELNLGRRMNIACNDPAWNVQMPRSLPAANVDPSVMLDKNGNRIPIAPGRNETLTTGFNKGTIYEKGKAPAGLFGGKQRYITREIMDEYIEATIQHAREYTALGYDGGYLDLSHNFPIGQFLRACVNHRTDEYGGSLENRMRFPIEVIRRLREAVGENYILSINSPVLDGDSCGDGMTLDELAVFLKKIQPYIDLFHLRRRIPDHKRPPETCQGAEYSAYLKSRGITVPIAISTPYKDLDKLEEIIAKGQADFIAPGHLFISNENLGSILRNGNGEDLNPCIECHCCRGTSSTGEWASSCSINPEMGLEYRLHKIRRPVGPSKRVAVIGGGPGGMKCAMYLKDRGHEPVIFEASDELGGQIKMAKYPDFKWELLRYLEFLKTQVEKRGIEVRLNTFATPDYIEQEGFDAVVAAIGGTPRTPDIPGAESVHWNPVNIYGNKDQIGHKVVVVGGASSATEAAAYLSQEGHDVIQISRKDCLGYDLNPIRMIPYMNILANTSGVAPVYQAVTTEVGPEHVTYKDQEGTSHTILCDDVVLSGGMMPCSKQASAFASCAPEFYMVGDCRQNGTMRNAIRDAFGVAMQI